MATLKCTCGQPLRFLGSIGVQIAGGFGEVVGVECPDKECGKHRVIPMKDWIESLPWLSENERVIYEQTKVV